MKGDIVMCDAYLWHLMSILNERFSGPLETRDTSIDTILFDPYVFWLGVMSGCVSCMLLGVLVSWWTTLTTYGK